MQKKTILMVHNFYQIGGGEHTVFENEVSLLRNHGHKVIVYTRSNNELKKSKLKLLLLPLSMIWSFKTYREVKRIIIDENIDIVHCQNTFLLISPSVYYAARRLKIPVIQTIHNFRFLCPAGVFYRNGDICEECNNNNSFKEAIKNKCYKNSILYTFLVSFMLKFHRLIGTYNKISYIFLTTFNRDKFNTLINTNLNNVYIKPNFVNLAKGDVLKGNKELKFIFAGRLEKNKGIIFLLDVWKELSNDFQLHIYGDGTQKDKVEKAVECNNNIHYFGFKSQKEIFEDLASSNGLLFPSNLYEGYPMIIAECFSIGVPVISTNIGNQKIIIESSNGGTLFEYGDNESFKKALESAIVNYKFFSENAKKYYHEYLGAEYNYKELVNIYEKAKHID